MAEVIAAQSDTELVEAALEADARGDEDARWDYVRALHRRGTAEALNAALQLCSGTEPPEQVLGANILGQLGGTGPDNPFRQQAIPPLRSLLCDSNADVVAAAIFACGHLQVPILDPMSLAKHASADVRHALASALPYVGMDIAPCVLIELMNDEDSDVRNWATFGLGTQLDEDTPAVRDALLKRTVDSDNDTRAEALVGLARRRDDRVIPPLLKELKSASVGSLAVEAAREIAAPELYEPLAKLVAWWDVDVSLLNEALEATRQEQPR